MYATWDPKRGIAFLGKVTHAQAPQEKQKYIKKTKKNDTHRRYEMPNAGHLGPRCSREDGLDAASVDDISLFAEQPRRC